MDFCGVAEGGAIVSTGSEGAGRGSGIATELGSGDVAGTGSADLDTVSTVVGTNSRITSHTSSEVTSAATTTRLAIVVLFGLLWALLRPTLLIVGLSMGSASGCGNSRGAPDPLWEFPVERK